jgi:hypothetical protein
MAGIRICNIVADGTLAHFFLGFADGVRKRERLIAVHPQQEKCQTLRGFLPNPWKAFQFVNQSRH